ncbi:aspartate racemase [Penicillium cosmopolitanum]|uniref:Aspartate racemase n=1 Tax=Penicillium cosmopolitanum TaxID=1131564 RepID=A0A9W9WAU2_9EURO|nr:aspartate racemase [Penicillium cosmopolitanum]KAJ5413729.1 aspartate racemase [Penicillium cosmopolitanum]
MKTIGIVGGISWPSSSVYYKKINEYFQTRTQVDGLHTPKLILIQTDLALIVKAEEEDNWDEVGRLLSAEATKLKRAGADFFLLACNTVHAADGYIVKNVDLPMLHIVDAAAGQILKHGFTTVGLLGSRYTMTGTYFVGRLKEKYGLNVLVAEGQHEENVHTALFQELARNIFLPETREKFKAAIADLVSRGAQAIILGCTEFGLLVTQEDSAVPIIDTSIAHAEAAVDLALSPDFGGL